MGGSGSGHRWDKKTTVEASLALPITHLQPSLNAIADNQGLISYGTSEWSLRGQVTNSIRYQVERTSDGAPIVRFLYNTQRRGAEPINSDYSVRVAWTRPHYGGRRWWWLCPLVTNGVPCGRRVGKLYNPPGAIYFGCRHCYNLTYTSCQESHQFDRIWKQLARDLDWDWEIVRDLMHQRYNLP